MKLIIKYLNLFVLTGFSLFFIQNLQAQNFEETIRFADSQYKSGNLQTSLRAYQRALFFSEGKENFYLFSQIAGISYLEMDYETAQKFYGLAYFQSENDSLRTELLFRKAVCQILSRKFQNAKIDLFSINDSSKSIQQKVNFYLATCYFGLEDFKNAKICFELCVSEEDKNELSDLFADRNLFSPSPRKAKVMSIILPGLGQTYSGDIKAGLNSFLLTSGILALGVNIAIKYQPLDALFSMLPWLQRYYTGGFEKAEDIAREKRQHRRNEVYSSVLSLIKENPIKE